MTAAYEEDHVGLIRDGVRSFVEGEIRPHVTAWEDAGDFPVELFKRVGELGYFGLKFSDRWGGTGPDWRGEAALTEELHRCGSAGVANALGAHKDLGCHYLHAFGTDEQRDRMLPEAIAGRRIGALAITEPDGGSDVAALRTRAKPDGNGWRLAGQKVFITNGDIADYLIVAARTREEMRSGAIGLFLVETPAKGLTTRRLPMLGWKTSHTCEVFLDDVVLGPDALLGGEEGQGFAQMMQALQWERVVMAIGAVAAADRALEDGIEYAKERRAFGRSVLDNQVWQHRFADLLADLEAARALAWRALDAHAAGSSPPELAAMSKLVAVRTACRVTDEVVQVFGGYGYSMEYPAQRYFRDARLGPIGGGTSEILREIISGARLR